MEKGQKREGKGKEEGRKKDAKWKEKGRKMEGKGMVKGRKRDGKPTGLPQARRALPGSKGRSAASWSDSCWKFTTAGASPSARI